IEVVRNSTTVQAVKHTRLGLTMANTFASGRHEVAGISIDGPASVIVRRTSDRQVAIAVSDPTMDRDSIAVVLRGPRLRLGDSDEGVTVSHVPGGTRIVFPTRRVYGRSIRATLRH